MFFLALTLFHHEKDEVEFWTRMWRQNLISATSHVLQKRAGPSHLISGHAGAVVPDQDWALHDNMSRGGRCGTGAWYRLWFRQNNKSMADGSVHVTHAARAQIETSCHEPSSLTFVFEQPFQRKHLFFSVTGKINRGFAVWQTDINDP